MSRTLFALPYVAWQFMPAFVLGSCLGIVLAWGILTHLNVEWLPFFIGTYILCHLWWPAFSRWQEKFESFHAAGALQTGLGPIVGTTGPLTTTLLMSRFRDKEAIVSTNAIFMSFTHITKISLFALMGFTFVHYWQTILVMAIGAIAGSYVGTQWLIKLNEDRYLQILKWVLTLLALRMIVVTFR